MNYVVGQSVDFLYPSSVDGSLVRRIGTVTVVDDARQSITVNTTDGIRQFKLSRIAYANGLAGAKVNGSEPTTKGCRWIG